jgi:hypothetical protein
LLRCPEVTEQSRHGRGRLRVRGRVDLIINGSFWLGTMFGAALSLVLPDKELVGDIERESRRRPVSRWRRRSPTLIRIRQRKSIGFGMIVHTAFKLYPKRTVLGLALFVGQAFLRVEAAGRSLEDVAPPLTAEDEGAGAKA